MENQNYWNTRSAKIHISVSITFILAFASVVAFAGKDHSKENVDPELESSVQSWMQKKGGLHFAENKGQMADLQDGYSAVENRAGKCAADTDLLFKASNEGLDIYITTTGLSYVFNTIEKSEIPTLDNSIKLSSHHTQHENERTIVHYCRADMELAGADIRKENVLKELQMDDRTDYYLAQCPEGVRDVHSYEKITIRNVYPGIDWVLYSVPSTESFVVSKTSTSPDYTGLTTNDQRLKTNTGGFKYDFIVHPGADPSLIRLRYKWTDKPLLQRDGSLKIRTPAGYLEEGPPVSYQDNKRHRITTSYVLQGDEIRLIPGKYDPGVTLVIDPTLIWATYYGGSSNDEINSVHTDGQNVWVTGSCTSNGFPTLSPPGGQAYFQGSFVGKVDLIILQFSSCGQLIWSTYYGGSQIDIGQSICSDGRNVWVTGSTSSADFPLQIFPGAYNQVFSGGAGVTNAFVLQFSCASNSLIWATCYGGKKTDIGNSISSDGIHVWVTGQTSSTDFPLQAIAGAYNQPAKGSGLTSDAFLLQFSCSGGVLIWATFYGGNDLDYGTAVNSDGTTVWVTGYTQSTNFPVQFLAGAYNHLVTNGGGDAFILEFAVTGTRTWASYYGGSGSDVGYSISSDGKNAWLTGVTESIDFPVLSPAGAFTQPLLGGGGSNAFILQLSCVNSSQIWSTYYGGSGIDAGNSISSDGTSVWVCGQTGSSDFPTESSGCGYFLGTPGGGNNVFILQFTTAGVRKWATFYGNDSENDGSYISSDGNSVFVSGDAYIGSTYPTRFPVGTYADSIIGGGVTNENVIIAKFSILCSSLLLSPDMATCAGTSVILNASGASSYSWTPPAGLNATTGSSVMADPDSTTTYTVTGLSAGCPFASAAVRVNVLPEPALMAISTNTCQGETKGLIKLSPTLAGAIYKWSNGSSGLMVTGLDTGTYTITVTDVNGCTATTSASILQLPDPIPIVGTEKTISQGQTVQLVANGGTRYLWAPSASLNNDTIYNPIANPNQTTSYRVIVRDVNNCSAIDSVLITVVSCEASQLFIPTAFSPNGDGDNDMLYVRAPACITAFRMQVYDRWGELVFETTDRLTGWDGTFRGKEMDPAVFVYYLTATLSNGQKISGKGNVTLLK